jgi:hypothetical protein
MKIKMSAREWNDSMRSMGGGRLIKEVLNYQDNGTEMEKSWQVTLKSFTEDDDNELVCRTNKK